MKTRTVLPDPDTPTSRVDQWLLAASERVFGERERVHRVLDSGTTMVRFETTFRVAQYTIVEVATLWPDTILGSLRRTKREYRTTLTFTEPLYFDGAPVHRVMLATKRLADAVDAAERMIR